MTQISTATTIARPLEQLYPSVTAPAHWPERHPCSLGVTAATDHSLMVGEQVTEECSVAVHRGSTTWTVREREAPHRWFIASDRQRSLAIVLAVLSPTSSPHVRAAPSSSASSPTLAAACPLSC